MPMPIQLGDHVRDRVTGFEGIAAARYVYLWGCVRIEVAKQGGDKPETVVFDEDGLEFVKKTEFSPPGATTGGSRSAPTR